MRHGFIFSAAWWPFLVVPLILLLVFGALQWRAVEQDIALRSRQVLAEPEYAWADLHTFNRGRDLLLSGLAPSPEAVTAAMQLLTQAEGVRRVDFTGEVSPQIIPSNLDITWSANKLILSGEMDSQASIITLVDQASASFGVGRVESQLASRRGLTPLTSLQGLFAALSGAGEGISLSISGDDLTLTGEVDSAELRDSLEAALGKIFTGKLTNHLVVNAPPQVEIDVCQELLRELLTAATINFESGEATISTDSFSLLEQVKRTANRCPEAEFEVAGHTDATGDVALNMALSKRRAQAVIDHLAGINLDVARFTAEGYGPRRPIASNNTRDGRARNRRIEFNLRNR
ncbi:MAG: OmpA family protein [Gammaproteobacteria bacterium]|nr:OmpA family protein [Gammaproteobacteria bacterium]